MIEKEKAIVHEEEIDLYELYRTIAKRKYIIIGLFIFAIFASSILSFLMPKIYRGEAVFKISTKEITTKETTTKEITTKEITTKEITTKEITALLSKLDAERIRTILPKTYAFVSQIKIQEVKNSADKIQLSVESKYPDKISDIIMEFVQYLNNTPLIKGYIEETKERLLTHSSELSKIIREGEKSVDTLKRMLHSGKLTIVGFNPVEVERKLLDLKIEKISVDQALKNLKGIELLDKPYISSTPVKPKTKLIILISAVSAILVGIMIVLVIEYVEKIKKEKKE